MTNLAEVFPPGDFIREELEERNWTQADLAEIMGRPVETINRLVTGKLAVTAETARGLGEAFGTSAEYWLNMESLYRLSHVAFDDTVVRRARLYSKAPIKDMVKRGWIESSSNIKHMEHQIVAFYELESLEDTPECKLAARMSTDYGALNPAQTAWYFRARQLASSMQVVPFRKGTLGKTIEQLRALAVHPSEARIVPRVLADGGIRFVVVEHLPKSKIDGAAFWLDKSKPVIAMSLRFDRIDYFWHTLMHEVGHIKDGAMSLDSDILDSKASESDDRPQHERQADLFACETLIPKDEIDDFIKRVGPLYSKAKVEGFANRMDVHPGIVVGQLQHRGEVSYSYFRHFLSKIRHAVTESALTDGWGRESN